MASPEKIKKYQREKFENYKRINELKINNNEAYIELKVNKIQNILNDYTLKDKIKLKKEFFEEIEYRASYIPLDYPIVLEIYNDNFTSEEKIMIRRNIKNHFEFEAINRQTNLKAITRKSTFFLIIGIIGFALLVLLYKINARNYIEDIVSFLSSFSIWQFAELRIFEEDAIKEEIIRYKMLSKLRIVYNKEDS
ncbi:MAG TPA: hypothetical protein DCE23_09330 [Firmicutes bacterium]|nr:hypothetical protein [Bacillota bacterium]